MREYKLFGTIGGKIWMPPALCYLDVDSGWFTFTDADTYCPPNNGFPGEYPDFRTALISTFSSGDFQSSDIIEAYIKIRDRNGNRTVEKTVRLRGKDSNRDLWAKPWLRALYAKRQYQAI